MCVCMFYIYDNDFISNNDIYIIYVLTLVLTCIKESICDVVRPRGEAHGTPPNNSAPGLSRNVYFNAIKNPVAVDRSNNGSSTISNFFLGALDRKSKQIFGSNSHMCTEAQVQSTET